MVPPDQLERPRVTEIQVRMDCNGCVQKIKKALHGINGIYDLYIDFPQQKLTIIGWADPERIMKAIKKTRKIATICSHTEQQAPPTEQPPDHDQQPTPQGDQPPPPEPSPANPPPPPEGGAAPPQPEQAPPPEPPPPDPDAAPAIQHPPHVNPHQDHARNQAQQVIPPKDVGEVHHVIHHHAPPPDHHFGYSRSYNTPNYWNKYSNSHHHDVAAPAGQGIPVQPPHHQEGPPQPSPVHVAATTHSYNMHQPSNYVTEYYHHHGHHDHHDQYYIRSSPPRPILQRQESYNNMNYYNNNYGARNSNYTERYNYYHDQEPISTQYYYHNNNNSNGNSYSYNNNNNNNNNGNITSIFSDENPNACRIV